MKTPIGKTARNLLLRANTRLVMMDSPSMTKEL
jgi:hypothetical protein